MFEAIFAQMARELLALLVVVALVVGGLAFAAGWYVSQRSMPTPTPTKADVLKKLTPAERAALESP